MRRFAARYQAPLLLAFIVACALAAGWAVSLTIRLPADDEFNVVRWELTHLPNKWLYLGQRLFGGRLSPEEEDERLGRFLVLSAEIAQAGSTASSDDLRRERDTLENDVEAIIEGRLTAVLEDAGMESSPPLLPGPSLVFPPVDIEIERPLQVLTVSPRDRIARIGGRALAVGFTTEQAARLERAVEADGSRSALVEPVAGTSTYPAIVAPRADYRSLVETAAHEWVHHYLFFKPLGRRYLDSLELRTLNETVANLAGEELAALVVERYPLPPAVAAQIAALSPEPAIDVDAVLRRLRLDVDKQLAQGRVADAEALMEQRRSELAAQGVEFRRINQAFFAFRNQYADTAASTDPIGPKLDLLLARSSSVGDFLRRAAQLTSAGDLDRRLAAPR